MEFIKEQAWIGMITVGFSPRLRQSSRQRILGLLEHCHALTTNYMIENNKFPQHLAEQSRNNRIQKRDDFPAGSVTVNPYQWILGEKSNFWGLASLLDKKSNENFKILILGFELASFLYKKSRLFSRVYSHNFQKYWIRSSTLDFLSEMTLWRSQNHPDRG